MRSSVRLIHSRELESGVERDTERHFGYELAVIYARFERDGFTRLGTKWGELQEIKTPEFHFVYGGDDGWGRRPARGYQSADGHLVHVGRSTPSQYLPVGIDRDGRGRANRGGDGLQPGV